MRAESQKRSNMLIYITQKNGQILAMQKHDDYA